MSNFIISFDNCPIQLTLIPPNVPMSHTKSEHFLMPRNSYIKFKSVPGEAVYAPTLGLGSP